MTHDPRGQKLPVYIAQLAEHLTVEQATLKTELELIRNNIEHIKTVVAMEQNCAKLAGETTVTEATISVETAIIKNAHVLEHQNEQIPSDQLLHSVGSCNAVQPRPLQFGS